jgi:F0F1-type ATP synthase assembly protein I
MAHPPKPARGAGPDGREYAGIGVTFSAVLLACTFLGSWLDGKLGTSPWLLLLGVFGGFGLSVLWIYRRLVIVPREREKERE